MKSMKLFLLLSFTALIMLRESYGFTNETDRQALLDFKSQVFEDKQGVLSSWNNSFPLCSWTGVTCGRKHKRVTSLDLVGFHLGGVISPSIGNLSFLISLDLLNNSFGGTIPQELGNLFRLRILSLDMNALEGGIPTSLVNCSRLLGLHLYSNHLGPGVPSELGSLTNLVHLDLGHNNLKGKIPAFLGNMTSLRQLSFNENNMEGEIPDDLARLSQIEKLLFAVNRLSGVFPHVVYNMSSLKILNIFNNNITGSLRNDFGNFLPNLRMLAAGSNSLTGALPTTLSNISSLEQLSMEDNSLTGSISPSFGKVQNLRILALGTNHLGSNSSGDLNFLDALTNCTQLDTIYVVQNRLGGDLPNSIVNLSVNLVALMLDTNFISGTVPRDIGNLRSLQLLRLGKNLLTGKLPTSLGRLSGLHALSFSSNRLSKEIPSSLGNITQLGELYLPNNGLEGTIPPSLSNCSNLLRLHLEYNKLNGTIPLEIMQIAPLFFLNLSYNSLTGSLPKDVGRLEHLGKLSLAHNKLSGKLQQTLGKCLQLEQLQLQGNFFDGVIPDISGLMGVKEVDFSNNNLSGSIPGYFANFSSLEYLNISVNNFEGEVPTEGIFKNATIVSVFGNKNLCGGVLELKLKPCFSQPQGNSRRKLFTGVGIGISLLLLLFAISVFFCWFKNRKKNKTSEPTFSTLGAFHEMISYRDLRNATNGFSSSNFVGSGSFGTVFKALLSIENKVVAVKVLNLEKRGALRSFMAECESLKDIRHRNLVKLLTACSSIDFQGEEFKALIYEFMPNGSLDMWLHPKEVEEIRRPSRTLTLLERLNIAIDVAYVMDYLHVHCHEPIAHCDLKPSNVLLDDDLTAHVSDFGLARILLKLDHEYFLNQLSSGGVRGTIGYAAPEYGIGGHISIYGDVYSFGILLLEMFSGKRPTNESFGGNFTLRSCVASALPERVLDVADEMILHNGLRTGFPIVECLSQVFEVGLRCCEESPIDRLAMTEVVKELILIRERFFKARRGATRH